MAGRGNKKQSRKNDENKRWLLGVYGRRSFDDGENSESYTIKNQKALIESFIENLPNVEIEDYYIDDGYTGTNFERPGFKRMLQDVLNGKINGIIVKDLSRLGRNHKEVGKYIEEIFPIYDIRIISVNDNVDSYLDPESISSLIVPVKNLMNENYSRKKKKKVSSAYEIMAKGGQFVAGTPPYGYMLDPEDKHHLIPDHNEVDVVKKIFDMAWLIFYQSPRDYALERHQKNLEGLQKMIIQQPNKDEKEKKEPKTCKAKTAEQEETIEK